jgi:hypothetical protein
MGLSFKEWKIVVLVISGEFTPGLQTFNNSGQGDDVHGSTKVGNLRCLRGGFPRSDCLKRTGRAKTHRPLGRVTGDAFCPYLHLLEGYRACVVNYQVTHAAARTVTQQMADGESCPR